MNHAEFHELAWSKLEPSIKEKAAQELQKAFAENPEEWVDNLKKAIEIDGLGEWLGSELISSTIEYAPGEFIQDSFHFGAGMAIRNYLRDKVTLDADLPPIPEYYGEGHDQGNWDDYYVQCIEAALGFR